MHKIEFEITKTYANHANVEKAVVKKFGLNNQLRYFIMEKDGRYFPVFVGSDALHAGVHFHFHVVM